MMENAGSGRGLYPVSVLGFGDNVVDCYEHQKLMYPGGNAVNFAVYAKRFGAVRSAYMGIFGTDMAAEHVISSLQEESVELFECIQVPGENGAAHNTVRDGDRIFLWSNEGGIRGDMRLTLDRFRLEYVKSFDLVHSGNYSFTERELKKIRKAGVPVSFDFSDDSTDEYYRLTAPDVDFAFLSMGDAKEQEVREKLHWVQSLGPAFVCASRGAAGCMAFDGTSEYCQEAMPVPVMADTMGAGDSLLTSFLVGYISRLKKQGTEDILSLIRSAADPAVQQMKQQAVKESLREAACFAATVCGQDGAWGHGVHYE